jgi:hypothetical protein
MTGAIAANQDVYGPRYAGSDDFGGFDDPYGDGGDPYGGDGGFIGDMFGLFGAPSGEGTAIQNAGAGARNVGKWGSALSFVPGFGLLGTGLSAIAGLTELDAINSALEAMHGKMGLQSPVQSISMIDALTRAAFNPFVDLQDLVAPIALDMEAEDAVNQAAAAAAAVAPVDETFGEGFDPGEFGGPGGYGGIGQAETAPGSTPGWGSQGGYGGDFDEAFAGGGPDGGYGGPGAGTDSESYGGGEYGGGDDDDGGYGDPGDSDL